MIIEDNPDIRFVTASILRRSSYRVLTVANGREALSVLFEHQLPDAIILDWEMPEMNGREFLAKRMQIDWLSVVPVIVYSGHSLIEKEVADFAISACLPKAIDSKRLLDAVEDAIRIRRN